MQLHRLILLSSLLLVGIGCGGKWVNDKDNFARAFGSKQPADVEVVQSIFVRTPHFTEEHEFYFQMKPLGESRLMTWLTNDPGIIQSTNGLAHLPYYLNLRDNRPEWFASDALTNYQIWHSTNQPFIVMQHRQTKDVFVYGSVGM
jgi:hypothetical protein